MSEEGKIVIKIELTKKQVEQAKALLLSASMFAPKALRALGQKMLKAVTDAEAELPEDG